MSTSYRICIAWIARRLFGFYRFFLVLFICVLFLIFHRRELQRNSTLSKLEADADFVKLQDTNFSFISSLRPTSSTSTFNYSHLIVLYKEAVRKFEERGHPKSTRHFMRTLGRQLGIKEENLVPKKILLQERISLTSPLKLHPRCSKAKTLLLVLVLSGHKYYHRREAIRLSWGSSNNLISKYLFGGVERKTFTWKTIFAIGQPSDEESKAMLVLEDKLWKDILVLDYEDDYTNLTNKTMKSLEWIATRGQCTATYILKTDDDCFVNHVALLPWLQALNPAYKYVGKLQDRMVIVRDPKSRYYVPMSTLEGRFYPPYCSGGGYVLKYDILGQLVQNSKRIEQVRSEDAYIGMVFKTLKQRSLLDNRFLMFIYDRNVHVHSLSPCKAKKAFVIHNVVGKGQLVYHWRSVVTKHFEFLCDKWVF